VNIYAIRAIYEYDPRNTHTGIHKLLRTIRDPGPVIKDVTTTRTSLEEIFVNLASIKS